MTAHDAEGTAPTLSERLAAHVVSLRFEDVPVHVVDKTKWHLVHHFGVAFRGHGSEPARQAVGTAFELSGAGGSCTIIGQQRPADLLEAAFANALLMGHGGLDDLRVNPPGGAHPGIVVQPVAWAVGETTRASGRELLTAVIAGYDVLGKLCQQIWPWGLDPPRRTNTIVGPFGAAAAAARLFGLSAEQTAHAFGYAGQSSNGGIFEGSEGMPAVRPLAARNGLLAAVLAKAGMRATPTILEGRHGMYRSFFGDVPDTLDDSLRTLGHEFEVTNMQTRPYPVSALDFVPIELINSLVRDHALTPSSVASIYVVLPTARERREAIREDGRLGLGRAGIGRGSLRYRIAAVVIDGHVDEARLERPPDTDARPMQDRIRLRFESDHPLRYARIEVTTIDGRRYSAEADTYVPPPLDWADWLSGGSGRTSLSDRQRDRLAELIRHLEDVPDVSEVMACVVPGRSGGKPVREPHRRRRGAVD